MFLGVNSHGFNEKEHEIIKVVPGDTLWKIAEEQNKNGDIRKYIYEIKRINQLEDSLIYPGMSLKLP